MPRSADDATLVLAVRQGDQGAFTTLVERWSDRCYDVARRIVHDDGAAADVVQDALVAAWRRLDTLQDPAAFGGWVLRITRNRALDRLESIRRSAIPVDLADPEGPELVGDNDVEADVTAADQGDLVWAASAVLGERDASVLSLHLRHGLGAAEIGEELGVTANNAHQLLFRMKKRLAVGIRAYVVYQGGRPSCPALRATLAVEQVEGFSKQAAEVIDRHIDACDDCDRRRAAVLAPEALFAAVPVLVLAPGARQALAEGLRQAGVPIDDPAAEPPTGAVDDPDPDGVNELDEPVDDGATSSRSRRRRVLGALVAVLLLLGCGLLLARGDDPDEVTTAAAEPADATTTTEADGGATSTTSMATTAMATTTTKPSTAMTFSSERPTTTVSGAAPATTQPPSPAPPAPPPSTFSPQGPGTVTTTTAPPAPRIDAFTAVGSPNPDGPCPIGKWATTFTWSTAHATAVRISASGEQTLSNLPPDGQTVLCRNFPNPPNSGWTLRATGPGGAVEKKA